MAIYALSIAHRGRSSGISAGAHEEYLARKGKYEHYEARSHESYLTREGMHQKRAHELEATWSGNLPGWAKTSGEFWKAADTYERANGRVYSEVVMALPRELAFAQRESLVKEFIGRELGERFPYTVAMHNSRALDGGTQPHAHIMFSLREVDGIERSKEQFFKRANAAHPERGGAKKNREWSLDEQSNDRVREIRQSWEELANQALEKAGREERIDRRTLQAQGIEREPEPKMGPEVTQRVKRGEETELGAKVIALRQYREQQQALTRLETALTEEQAKVSQFEQEQAARITGELRFAGAQPALPLTERHRYPRTVDLVMTRQEQSDGTAEYRWKRSGRVAFTDQGERIVFQSVHATAVKAGLQVAKDKGWQTVIVTGTEKFRREAWLQARLMGMELQGYTPSLWDREQAMKLLREQAQKQEAYRARAAPTQTPAQAADHHARPRQPPAAVRQPERPPGQPSAPVPSVQWKKASELAPIYAARVQQLEQERTQVEHERQKVGWQWQGWRWAYPPPLTPEQAQERARLAHEWGRLQQLRDAVTANKTALTQVERQREQFTRLQATRGLAQYLPRYRREGWALAAAVQEAREQYERSVHAMTEVEQAYDRAPHREEIAKMAHSLLGHVLESL
jgi:hypothetical protein